MSVTVFQRDRWLIRYTWSSGQYVEDYWQSFRKAHQEKDSDIDLDEASAKKEESERACFIKGLDEMGYENPEDYL